jgi:penicillin-binding protein A
VRTGAIMGAESTAEPRGADPGADRTSVDRPSGGIARWPVRAGNVMLDLVLSPSRMSSKPGPPLLPALLLLVAGASFAFAAEGAGVLSIGGRGGGGIAGGGLPPRDLAHGFGALRERGHLVLAVRPPPALGPFALDEGQRAYFAPWGDGTARLTLEPALMKPLVEDLRLGRPQWGATVILDIESGRILALAQHSERDPEGPGAALRPIAKAASVYKIVTASALVRAGVPLSKEVCGSGGKTRMKPRDLESSGGRCVRFEDALPYSANVAMAKLAAGHLTPGLLLEESERYGFDRPLTAELPLEPSTAEVPVDDTFAFANTAAGFGQVRLSALHGAVIAAVAASGGLLVPPRIIDSVEGEDAPPVPAPERVLDEEQADLLQGMLAATVSRGTAYAAFHGRKTPYGRPAVIDVPVAGKTGSLTVREEDLDVTWFVGSAPAHDPKIAIATVIINDEWIWHVRALDVATRAVATYFRVHPEAKRVDDAVASSPPPQPTTSSLQ